MLSGTKVSTSSWPLLLLLDKFSVRAFGACTVQRRAASCLGSRGEGEGVGEGAAGEGAGEGAAGEGVGEGAVGEGAGEAGDGEAGGAALVRAPADQSTSSPTITIAALKSSLAPPRDATHVAGLTRPRMPSDPKSPKGTRKQLQNSSGHC